MKITYFDCFCGAAGDMIVAACLDAGAPWDQLQQDLAQLNLSDPFTLRRESINKNGIQATAFHVDTDHHHHHRHLPDIQNIIRSAKLSDHVKHNALNIFENLARAEAKIHDIPIEQVHFHEVGAVDAIVDIVGACIALETLGIDAVYCSPLVTGTGTVKCAHGTLPVPAPATAELIKNIPITPSNIPMELLTPTGAAVLTTLAKQFGPPPPMTIRHIGYGAGLRDCDDRPNVLRLLIGETTESPQNDLVCILQANLDDCTGELIGHACESLMQNGALDAFTTPIMMKKNRPAVQITVICDEQHRPSLEQILFRQTTTFGIRRHLCQRTVLDRTLHTVQTPFGPIRIKTGDHLGQTVSWSVEFEDCRNAAKQHNVPVKNVIAAAQLEFIKSRPS